MDTLIVNNNVPQALIGPFTLNSKDWEIRVSTVQILLVAAFWAADFIAEGRERQIRGSGCRPRLSLFCTRSQFTYDPCEIKHLQQKRHTREDQSGQLRRTGKRSKDDFV